MSTDGFTEAAEAARAYARPRADLTPGPKEFEYALIFKDFMAGAEWARAYLAAQESTEAETPDPSVDYHAMWWKAEREREKAERERDDWHRAALTMQTERDEHKRTRAVQEPTVAEVLAVRTALADQMPQNWWGGEQWYRYAQEAVAVARAARRDKEKR